MLKKNNMIHIVMIITAIIFIMNVLFNSSTTVIYMIYLWTTFTILFVYNVLCIIAFIKSKKKKNKTVFKPNDVINNEIPMTVEGLQRIHTIEHEIIKFMLKDENGEIYMVIVVDGNIKGLIRNPVYKMITHRPKSKIIINRITGVLEFCTESNIDMLFETGPRYHKQTPLYILHGDSGVGKSWIGTLLTYDKLNVYETDAIEDKEGVTNIDFSHADVVVVGNKHKMDVDEILSILPKDRDVITMYFKKEYE